MKEIAILCWPEKVLKVIMIYPISSNMQQFWNTMQWKHDGLLQIQVHFLLILLSAINPLETYRFTEYSMNIGSYLLLFCTDILETVLSFLIISLWIFSYWIISLENKKQKNISCLDINSSPTFLIWAPLAVPFVTLPSPLAALCCDRGKAGWAEVN